MKRVKRRALGALTVAALVSIVGVAVPASIEGQRLDASGLFGDADATRTASRAEDGRALRWRSVTVDIAQIAAAQRSRSTAGAPPRLLLNLFPDATFDAVLDRIDVPRSGFVWVGHVQGVPESSVTLAVEGDVIAGSVVTPEGTFTIRYAGNSHVVAQVDQASYPSELPPLVPVGRRNVAGDAAAASAGTAGAQSDDGSTIDVMVLYTPAVTAYRVSDNAVRALVNLGVSETNTSYGNSGIAQRLRLVYTGEVGYSESGDMRIDLEAVTDSVGALNGVATLRNTYAADLVSLWVHYPQLPGCGIAWLMTNISSSFAPAGYSVADDQCVSPNYTFGHELGHNMGAGHDWFVDTGVAPRTYAHGYVYVPGRWRTIMAYDDMCAVQQFSCTRLLAWATPTRDRNGVPMGVAGGTSTACSYYNTANPPCDADDARLLNETAVTVANFRQAVPVALTVTALTPSVPSPSAVNTTVTWTAATSGGTGPITYRFVVFDGANWTVGQDWSASNQWSWTPTTAAVYSIQVWVRNAGSSALYDAWGQADYAITPPPLRVTSLTASPGASAPIGAGVTWTALASGGTGPYTFKFVVYDGTDWTVGRDWSASNTWLWSPPAPATYSLQVWVRNAGSGAFYDAWLASGSYRVTPPSSLTVTSLTSAPSSTAATNTSVLWSASAIGGTAPYTYRFLLWNGSYWTVGQEWSAAATWTWTPTVAGAYSAQVWARNAGSSAAYDAWRGSGTFTVAGPAPLSITGLVPSPASGGVAGQAVSWNAAATGGTGPYTYKFLLHDGATWSVGRDWSGSSSWSWTPSAAGSYTIQVWGRNAGSANTYDAWLGSAPFAVATAAPAQLASILTPVSPLTIGAPATWEATGQGGVAPLQYKFFRYRIETGIWTVGQDYSSSNVYTWTPGPGDAGTYVIQVWVRSAGSSADYEDWLNTSTFVVR